MFLKMLGGCTVLACGALTGLHSLPQNGCPGVRLLALICASPSANGGANWLVQRSVPGYAGGYGHCTFTPQELTQAFFDLVTWGEYGVKPTP